jgi:phage repressor protein C with HTH and peptisase S24 domain
MIEAKNTLTRQRALDNDFQQRSAKEHALKECKDNRSRKWLAKTKNSPFAVNLLAEDERVTEESRTRTNDQTAEYNDLDDKREKAKNDIILRVWIIMKIYLISSMTVFVFKCF